MAAVVGSLCLHVALLSWSAVRHSPVTDEVAHMAAGLSHWKLWRFNLFAVNPPLIRMVATIPINMSEFRTDWSSYSSDVSRRSEFAVGRDFIRANPDTFTTAFTMARWACIPFSILGGVVCFCWAGELGNKTAAAAALLLWCTSPMVLTFGAMMTPDAGAAALGVTACYLFRKWLYSNNVYHIFPAALSLGLCQLAKSTWLVLYAVYPLLWMTARLSHAGSTTRRWQNEAIQLCAIVLLSLYVINLGYDFEHTMRPLGLFEFTSEELSGISADENRGTKGNRFRDTWLAAVPIPVPASMLLGMDHIKSEFEQGYYSYLHGEHRKGGWWYYYLYGMAVKMPCGTLCLIAAALLTISLRHNRKFILEYALLLTPPICIIVLVSSQTGFNHHLRYVLPAFPFLFIFAGQVFALNRNKRPATVSIVTICLTWSVTSSLMTYPHTMSYFNESVGGPRNGWKHMDFSNIDWGHDMYFLKEWQEAMPDNRAILLSTRSGIDPDLLGIKNLKPLPTRHRRGRQDTLEYQPGTYVLSIHEMLQHQSSTAPFLKVPPDDRIGYSMRIYYLLEPLVIPISE